MDFSQAENTVARGHSKRVLPRGRQTFNGFLTLVITKEDSGHCGLENQWMQWDGRRDCVEPWYYCISLLPKQFLCTDVLAGISRRWDSGNQTIKHITRYLQATSTPGLVHVKSAVIHTWSIQHRKNVIATELSPAFYMIACWAGFPHKSASALMTVGAKQEAPIWNPEKKCVPQLAKNRLTGIIQLAKSPYFDTCIAPSIVKLMWPLGEQQQQKNKTKT